MIPIGFRSRAKAIGGAIESLSLRVFVGPSGCMEWSGAISDGGYGVVRLNGKTRYVHRVVYEAFVGPILPGLHIDHLCRNRKCCNPDHLDVVTPKENARRGNSPSAIAGRSGRCKRGHSLGDAYLVNGGARRMCRPCLLMRSRRYRLQAAEARTGGVA